MVPILGLGVGGCPLRARFLGSMPLTVIGDRNIQCFNMTTSASLTLHLTGHWLPETSAKVNPYRRYVSMPSKSLSDSFKHKVD
jgi:hypothetical protein